MNNGEKRKEEMTENPGRDDVHEQRSPEQPREGVVPQKTERGPRPPSPTQTDQERADWEGMAQPPKK